MVIALMILVLCVVFLLFTPKSLEAKMLYYDYELEHDTTVKESTAKVKVTVGGTSVNDNGGAEETEVIEDAIPLEETLEDIRQATKELDPNSEAKELFDLVRKGL